MKVISVEEHLVTPELIEAWSDLDPSYDGSSSRYGHPVDNSLLDCGDARISWMDRMGVDVQVLSVTTPGVQPLEPELAVRLARQTNDLIAEAIRDNPERFRGLTTLPTPDPRAAAAELRRGVCELGLDGGIVFGRTRDRYLDHPDNEPIFATAAELRAPLFVHPQRPRPPVMEEFYGDLPGRLGSVLAGPGLGWHFETGLQVVRMILAGVFDRNPDLQLVLGHWGDLILFYLDEIDVVGRLAGESGRPLVSDYVRRHIHVAPSGTLSKRYHGWATEVLGSDRLLLALDHPFVPREPGDVSSYLASLPIRDAERRGLASGNWEALVGMIRR